MQDSSPSPATEPGIQTVAVVGAGAMGRGIAATCAKAGLHVLISDVDPQVAEAAASEIRTGQQASSSSGQPSETRIGVLASDSDYRNVDLIIEAVAEKRDVKPQVLSHIESLVRPETLIASNSSSIPMGQLAECLDRPERFCGLHFCYPVDQRPLVEVVAASTTDQNTLTTAHRCAQFIGMAPVIVQDAPGFLLNRLLVPYLNEALDLVLEQADPSALEQTAQAFGFPAGPLAQLDDFGLDVALSVGTTLYQSFPDRIGPSELLIAMYKAGRLGRKTGHGFHFQDGVRFDTIVPDVQDIGRRRARQSEFISQEQIERRLLLPMLLEATRALEEQLVSSATVVDQVLQDGLGMTDRYRGLFGWADECGTTRILEWLKPLQTLGPRFEPTPLLLQSASTSAGPRLADWKSAA